MRPGVVLTLLLVVGSAFGAEPPSLVSSALAAAANLHLQPGLISPYDRSLLRDAKYGFPEDGTVRDPSDQALTPAQVREALERLRAERKQEVLAGLAGIQQQYLKSKGIVGPDEAGRLQAILARDWEIIPSDIKASMNDLLGQSNYKRVGGADLSLIEKITRDWRGAPPAELDLSSTKPYPDSENFRLKHGRLPAPGDIKTTVFERPSPEVVAARLKEIDAAAGYSEYVKDSLREIMRYAPDQDAEAVLSVIRQGVPIVVSNKDMVPFSWGSAHWPNYDESPKDFPPKVVLPEYMVYAPGGAMLPHSDAGYYERLGLPVPKVEALNPNAKPARVRESSNAVIYEFNDGSTRRKLTPTGLAGLLEHEIQHIATYQEGAGANMFTNEMRSMLVSQRLWFNRDEALGRTLDPSYGNKNPWLFFPITFRNGILQAYMSPEVGTVRPDAVTVDQQLAINARALAAQGEELQRLRAGEIDAGFNWKTQQRLAVVSALVNAGLLRPDRAALGRDRIAEMERNERADDNKDRDYRKWLLAQRERLLKDQELEQRILLDDWRWHASRGFSYLDRE